MCGASPASCMGWGYIAGRLTCFAGCLASLAYCACCLSCLSSNGSRAITVGQQAKSIRHHDKG